MLNRADRGEGGFDWLQKAVEYIAIYAMIIVLLAERTRARHSTVSNT